MRVLLCGAGSAGHVNPAIAIGETIKRNSPKSKIAYVATVSGIENDLVEFDKYHIDVRGIKRKLSFSNLKSIYLTLGAIKESKRIIKEFCPDIIIGTGGYATFPVAYAARKLGVKIALHESNAIPGKAIKMLEKYADVVFTNFKESEANFKYKEKLCHVGNPLRDGFYIKNSNQSKIKNSKRVILCYGGSLGAESLNNAAIDVCENLVRYRDDIVFILATGKRNYYDVCKKIKERRIDTIKNFIVYEYIYDMASVMASADLVISRAGAITISELAALSKASILVPSPYVADNHQLENARALDKRGAAVLVREDCLYSLTDTVRDLLANEEKREKMKREISEFYIPDANIRIYHKIIDILKK